jgi:hypothetical protein
MDHDLLIHEFVRYFWSDEHAELPYFFSHGRSLGMTAGHPLALVHLTMHGNIMRTNSLALMPFILKTTDGQLQFDKKPDHDMFDAMMRGMSLLPLAFETLFSALSINAWTTFEATATDLWIAAVNARPTKLGGNVAGSKDRGPAGIEPGKSVPFDQLMRRGFDISKHVGDILADRFTFTNFSELKRAYDAAFGKGSSISNIVNDPKLHLASQIRHVLVHRGGIVDDDFLRKTSGRQEIASARIGQTIPLDGKLVAMLVDDTARLSVKLFEEVFYWLRDNSD